MGAPAEVYERPLTEFVAGFVGTSNIVERGGRRISVRPERIELDGPGVGSTEPGKSGGGGVYGAEAETEPGTVADVVFVGAFRRIVVDTDAGDRLTVVRPNDGSTIEPGTRVHVRWRAEDAYEIQPPVTTNEQEVR